MSRREAFLSDAQRVMQSQREYWTNTTLLMELQLVRQWHSFIFIFNKTDLSYDDT